MNLWILLGALALNMILGRLFRPYTSWIVDINVRIAEFFGRKSYKHGKKWGTVLTIAAVAVIWAGIDVLVIVAENQSMIYSYIAYGLAVFFFVQCGQVSAMAGKFKGNLENTTYTKQLFDRLLVKDADKIEPSRYNKAYIAAYAEMLARRVILPMILIVFVGIGITAAYMFSDTLAASDRSRKLSSHSFTECAIKLSKIASWLGYVVLSLIIAVTAWVSGRYKKHKGIPFAQRCTDQLYDFFDRQALNDTTVRTAGVLVNVFTLCNALIILVAFILIETVLAAIGLDQYWDFWSGKNLVRDDIVI